MKKIFTLAAAVLASFSLWAADAAAPATKTYGDITFLDVAGTDANRTDKEGKDYLTYGVYYVAKTKAITTWFNSSDGSPASNHESTGYSITDAEDFGFFPTSSTSTDINYGGTKCHSGRQRYFYVTGATSVAAIVRDGGTSSNKYVQMLIQTVAEDGSLGTATTIGDDYVSASAGYVLDGGELDPAEYYKISFTSPVSSNSYMYQIRLGKSANCQAPATPLVLKSDANATVYVGDVINLSTTGGIPGAGIGIAGTAGETLGGLTNTTWTATAGEHTFVATQAAYEGYCAQESELVFNVLESTPVTAVTVDGPAAAYVGESVTFTATAENASDYAWTVNGVDANTNAAEFTFTPAAAGEYSIVCSARNKFNATEEWIASEAKVLTASTVSGVLVSYTVNSDANGAANLTGALAAKATAKVSLTKGSSQALDEYTGYKMDKGKYVGVTLTSGSFQEGDTVSFMVTKASGTAKLYLYDDEQGTNRLDSIDFSGQTGWATFVLNQATAGVYLYRSNPDVKPYDQNPHVAALKVIRPMAVKSTSEAFKSVSFNGEALVANFDENHAMTVEGSYVDAPVVVFTKTVTTIYEDNSQTTKDVEVNVTAEEVAGAWQAQAEINSVTYTINAAKAASVVVTYMDGETVLGTENVAINETVAEYAQYQSKNLATFVGWYQDVDLTIEANLEAPITAETYLYAKFENKYAASINIEKAVMENGKNYDIIAQLGTLGYASNITGSLDSLSVKDDGLRNYAYLGLKVKQNGALLNFRLAAGNTVTIKFGEIKKTPNVSINGGDYADMVITDKVYTHTAEADDELISIKMMDGNAVVFQQIMIGEELQDPELFAINCAEVENGTVAAPFKMGIPGETVELTFTPAAGYIVMSCTVNGTEIHQSAPGAAITFEMPAEDVTIETLFSIPTALENAEAAVKAEKVIRDGQVLILRDGKIFNALGAEVK